MANINYNYNLPCTNCSESYDIVKPDFNQGAVCFHFTSGSPVVIEGKGTYDSPANFKVKISEAPGNKLFLSGGLYVSYSANVNTSSFVNTASLYAYTASIAATINNVFISESNYLLTASFLSYSSSQAIVTNNIFISESNYLLTSSFNTISQSISQSILNVFYSESRYNLTSSFQAYSASINTFTASLSGSNSFINNQRTAAQSASFWITGSGLVSRFWIGSGSSVNTFTSSLNIDIGGNTQNDGITFSTAGSNPRLFIGYRFNQGVENNSGAGQIFSNANLNISSPTNTNTSIIFYTSANTSSIERMRLNHSGSLMINNSSYLGNYKLQVSGDAIITGSLILSASLPPTSVSSSGVAGQIAWDTGFLYMCIGSNSWKRTSLTTF